jgi:hypothetical protein
MQNEIEVESPGKPIRFRFHPLARWSMLTLAFVTACYCLHFMIVIIPQSENATIFVKALAIIILTISINTIYKHLTSLNSVIISQDSLVLKFLLRKTIMISWNNLVQMDIYKAISHYWKIKYLDSRGDSKIFNTSLAYPGIMTILSIIQERKPDIELNLLLKQVLLYNKQKLH